MRSVLIIVYPPPFDNIPGIFQADEPVFTKTLISKPADEALDIRIFYRLTRPDEIQLNAITISPFIQTPAREFRPVVQRYSPRQPSDLSQTIQDSNNSGPAKRCIYLKSQAFTRVIVHYSQSTEKTPRNQAVRYKVHRPFLIGPRRSRYDYSG